MCRMHRALEWTNNTTTIESTPSLLETPKPTRRETTTRRIAPHYPDASQRALRQAPAPFVIGSCTELKGSNTAQPTARPAPVPLGGHRRHGDSGRHGWQEQSRSEPAEAGRQPHGQSSRQLSPAQDMGRGRELHDTPSLSTTASPSFARQRVTSRPSSRCRSVLRQLRPHERPTRTQTRRR